MRLKFWQKTYILTLVLFLLCLDLCVFGLAYYSYIRNMDSAIENAKSEQYYISRSFDRDLNDLRAAGSGASIKLLMQTYCNFYDKYGTKLSFYSNDEKIYSSFAELPKTSENTLNVQKIDNIRYVMISSAIHDGDYLLVYGKSIEKQDNEFKTLIITYSLTAFGISVLTAILLYIVLHKLTYPLKRLQATAEAISSGDISTRADESGNDEFSDMGRSFNTMLDRINRQMDELKLNAEQKQRLVDNLAHELRTPLTSVYGYAEYLRRTKTTEADKIECAISIMNESARLQKISEILLDSSYINNNAIKKDDVILDSVIKDAAKRLENTALSHGCRLNFNGESINIKGDETLLSVLFCNLIENSVKACENGGEIDLSCGNRNGVVYAEVSDNGKGMTDEQLKHITEPFYRTDKSRSRADGGAGLGLALCKTIAQAHDAGMEFVSEPGKGTKVNVYFTKRLELDETAITSC